VQRLLTSLTLVGLLVATAATFAITERLKLTKAAIYGTLVSKTFSPKCGCARTSHAEVRFVLRRADTLDVTVIDAHRHNVATLFTRQRFPRGETSFRWDGVLDTGGIAPDGTYQMKIHLERQHQTIVLPNKILLDTARPEILSATPSVPAFSPDDDHKSDVVHIDYRLGKAAHVILYLGGRKILGPTYRHPIAGSVTWDGRAHGRLLRPGRYTLEVGAVDLAGNRTAPDQRFRVHVQLRYIVLANRRIGVRAGKFFEVGVSTDAPRYEWTLAKRKGRKSGPVLSLRAPTKPGTYVLTVSERGHVDRAHVVVVK
jgi:hypothetical protein